MTQKQIAPQQAAMMRIQAILDGQLPPPNESAKYVVDKVRRLLQSRGQMQETAQRLRADLATVEKQLTKTQGAIDAYVDDLMGWDDGTTSAQVPALHEPSKNGVNAQETPS